MKGTHPRRCVARHHRMAGTAGPCLLARYSHGVAQVVSQVPLCAVAFHSTECDRLIERGPPKIIRDGNEAESHFVVQLYVHLLSIIPCGKFYSKEQDHGAN
jgi:hypothetical protein